MTAPPDFGGERDVARFFGGEKWKVSVLSYEPQNMCNVIPVGS